MIWLFLFSFFSGITTWLFGFGGGFVTVPLLYLFLVVNNANHSYVSLHAMHIAVATSALVMLSSSIITTVKHQQNRKINWPSLLFIIVGITIGAIIGSIVALMSSGIWIRWLFISYLVFTILDCYFRPGFVNTINNHQPSTSLNRDLLIGTIIGIIAAFLGVGGSVMTVPLMRRRGKSMTEAAAIANVLTLPLALSASVTYLALSQTSNEQIGHGFVGYIWIKAALLLISGTWIGLMISERYLSHIPDKWHARIYPLLLILITCIMLFI